MRGMKAMSGPSSSFWMTRRMSPMVFRVEVTR